MTEVPGALAAHAVLPRAQSRPGHVGCRNTGGIRDPGPGSGVHQLAAGH
jgi:hypothetical protein